MKKIPKLLAIAMVIAMVMSFLPAPKFSAEALLAEIVISQVYGGGGNSGATYTNDFIELHNNGSAAVDITGWSVQYASATGSTWTVTTLSGTLQPGAYFLVQEAAGAGGTTPLPTPDATGSIAMSGTNGKVALINSTTALTGTCPGGTMDFVGYGSTANCYEGSGSTPTLSNTLAAIRNGSGCTDTGNNSADFTAGAPTPRNSATTAVTCSVADNPPSVSSTNPLNLATGVPVSSNLSVTFSEAVTVTDPWYSIVCTVSEGHTATVSGGTTTYTLDPTVNFTDGESCTLTIHATGVVDQDGTADAMASDHAVSFSVVDPCLLTFTPIYDIQGSGTGAAITGDVTTMGVVVGDYELPTGTGQIRGYFIQDETGDSDTTTSDGIFVYNAGRDNVSVGDLVRVTGSASDYQNQTQISALEGGTVACGTGTITPTDVTFPLDGVNDLEKFEGMLVRLPQTMYVTEHYQLGRFGQVTLSYDGRLQQPTNVVEPGTLAIDMQAANNLRKIILDDANNTQNTDPIVFARGGLPLSADNTLRGGDTATNIVGVLNYTWGGDSASPNAYRIRPINALNGSAYFDAVNPRPTDAPDVDGSIKVVGMNMLNYFNTFDGLPDNVDNCTYGVGGAAADCRGADTQAEFDRQWPKSVAAILKMDADVIGFNEIENDGYGVDSAIAELVDQLNAESEAGTYAFIDADTGTGEVNALGTDAIKVGMIYKPGTVTPIGDTAVLNTSEFVTGGDSAERNRPSLAQAFEVVDTGAVFIVDVNHLKSKGSACDVPDEGDGQGNCNQVRVAAAEELVNWLKTNPTGTGDLDILLVGDYNSYAMEDPIDMIKSGGYTSLIEDFIGADAYSYVFDGQWGYLDHAFGSSEILGQVKGVAHYHIDSDEPSVLDYNTDYKTANLITSLYSPDEFRISDHDPVIIGLEPNAAPTVEAGGPYMSDEGTDAYVLAFGSDPNDDLLTYAWDLDYDGTYETSGQMVTFNYPDGLTNLTIAVQVTDPGGLTGTDTALMVVNNVPPVVAVPLVNAEPSFEGVEVTLSATFDDPAKRNDEPYTCTVDYGDGSGTQAGVVNATTCTGPAHTYTTSGAYTVTVSVTDDDGAIGMNYRTHKVKATAPVAKWPRVSTTSKNPKFIWSVNPGETKYQINLYRKDGTLVKQMVINTPTCNAINCWYTPSPALNLTNGAYKWKVRSYLAAWSAYSPIKTFNKLDPPAPISPTGSIKDDNPKFTWVKIPGATKYTIVLSKNTGELVREIIVTAPVCGVVNCSYRADDPLNLVTQTYYKWKVRAFNGYFGPYSIYMFFQR